MKAEIRNVDGLTMMGRADSNHWVVMDTSGDHNGAGAGATPMEFVLMALGGCLAMTVKSLLSKKRLDVGQMTVELDAQTAGENPHVFTNVDVRLRFRGGQLTGDDVAWAVDLARKKYCPVDAMIERTAQVNCSWDVEV